MAQMDSQDCRARLVKLDRQEQLVRLVQKGYRVHLGSQTPLAKKDPLVQQDLMVALEAQELLEILGLKASFGTE